MKRALLLLTSLLPVACDDAPQRRGSTPECSTRPTPPTSASDVTSPGIPWDLQAAGEGFDVTVSGSPARLRLRRGATTMLENPEGMPLILIGTREGGPSATRFHDPRQPDPSGITWVAPTTVRSVDQAAGTVTLTHPATGDVVLRLVRTNADVLSLVVEARGPDVAMLRFDAPMDAGGYHGLGEQFAGFDARGRVVAMQLHVGGTASGTNEAHVPVPFMVSTLGYGVFVETTEAGAFDVGATEAARWSARFEGNRATVHLFAQPTPRGVIAAYTRLTGLPRLPPSWSFGHQQWRNAWDSDAQVLEDARRLRSEGIPTSTMWIDNPWQTSYSDHTIDRDPLPRPRGDDGDAPAARISGDLLERALPRRGGRWSDPAEPRRAALGAGQGAQPAGAHRQRPPLRDGHPLRRPERDAQRLRLPDGLDQPRGDDLLGRPAPARSSKPGRAGSSSTTRRTSSRTSRAPGRASASSMETPSAAGTGSIHRVITRPTGRRSTAGQVVTGS
jgi:hypothetical protein